MCSGYLTKQGRNVKSWKRRYAALRCCSRSRWFVLQRNSKLTYYSLRPGVAGAKILGWMDISICCAVLPGGRCIECQWPRASTSYCFGIISPQRKLFLVADSIPDLSAWLQILRDMLSPEIPVTNAREVEVSFKPSAPLPPLPGPSVTRRITLLRNGGDNQGRVVAAPADMPSCLALASSVLGIQATRLFTDKGGEITDFSLVRDDDVIYVSKGEPFADTATERLLRSALSLAETSGKQVEALHRQSMLVVARAHSERDTHSDDEAPFAFSNPMSPLDEDDDPGYVSAAMLRARALAQEKAAANGEEVFDEPTGAGSPVEPDSNTYMDVATVTKPAADKATAEDGEEVEAGYEEPVAVVVPAPPPPRRSRHDDDDNDEAAGYVAPDHASNDDEDEAAGYMAPGAAEPEQPPGYVALAKPDGEGGDGVPTADAPPPPVVLEPAPLRPPRKKVTSRVQF